MKQLSDLLFGIPRVGGGDDDDDGCVFSADDGGEGGGVDDGGDNDRVSSDDGEDGATLTVHLLFCFLLKYTSPTIMATITAAAASSINGTLSPKMVLSFSLNSTSNWRTFSDSVGSQIFMVGVTVNDEVGGKVL